MSHKRGYTLKAMSFYAIVLMLPSLVTKAALVNTVSSTVPQDTIRLEDVSVTVLPFNESLQEATGNVFAVRPDEMDLKNRLTSTSLINMAPGIHMASGTYNTNRLVIRGVGSRTPYNTNRIRAYMDDIPLTTGDGVSTLEDIDPASIGTIEILKGPSSALYGSGLGGIVKLTSPYPASNGFSARLFGEAGSFMKGRIGTAAEYKNDRLAATGGFVRAFSQGYRENSRYDRNNLFLNASYFGRKHTYALTLSVIDLSSQIPSSLNETDFRNEPWKAADNWQEVKGFESYTKALLGIGIKSDLGRGLSNRIVLFSSYSDPYESRPFNILDDRSFNLGFREYLQYGINRWNFSAGLEYFHEWYRWQIYETLLGERGVLLSDHDEIRRYANLFALAQWRPSGRWLIDGALNLNLLRYRVETNFRADSADQSGSYNYQPVLSPRIGISYRHHADHHLFASAGHGFSAPSLEETLLPEGMVNTSLKPETGWNVEIGNRGRAFGNRLTYSAAIYTILLYNLLVTERVAEDIFTGTNAGNALNTGLELLTRISLDPADDKVPVNAAATASYHVSHNRFLEFTDEGVDYSGNILPGIPLHKLNLLISGSLHCFLLRMHMELTGKQWMDDANSRLYKGYSLFHLQLSWKRTAIAATPFGIKVHAGIRNVFDTDHASMILVNAPSFGGKPPRYYYPGQPRQFHLGLELTYR